MNNLMSIQDVAKYLRVNNMWVRLAIKKGNLKAINISQGKERKIYRVSQTDLEEFLKRGGK